MGFASDEPARNFASVEFPAQGASRNELMGVRFTECARRAQGGESVSGVFSRWDPWGGVPPQMTLLTASEWEIVAGLTSIAGLGAAALWLVFRKRPTADELERARRRFLVQSGRLVDGMLLDICEVESPPIAKAEAGRTLTMLVFSYRIAGVDYECSQDITSLSEIVNASQVRAGFPCTVRYQPGNPQNSIVVAEEWSGLRAGLPQYPAFDDPEPLDLSHLRPGRG